MVAKVAALSSSIVLLVKAAALTGYFPVHIIKTQTSSRIYSLLHLDGRWDSLSVARALSL